MNKSNFLFRFSVRRFCIRWPRGPGFLLRARYTFMYLLRSISLQIYYFFPVTPTKVCVFLYFLTFAGRSAWVSVAPSGCSVGGCNTAFCDEKCEQNEGRFCSMWPLLPDKKNDDFGRFHRDGVGETVLLSDRLRGLDAVNLWFYSSRTMV